VQEKTQSKKTTEACSHSHLETTQTSESSHHKSKHSKNLKEEKVALEIKIIMQLPEVKFELIKRANPNNFDLYKCAFSEGGELEAYAKYLHKKLQQLYENQLMEQKRLELTLQSTLMATMRSGGLVTNRRRTSKKSIKRQGSESSLKRTNSKRSSSKKRSIHKDLQSLPKEITKGSVGSSDESGS